MRYEAEHHNKKKDDDRQVFDVLYKTMFLSSLASGLIAVTLTLLLTYLPSFWRGNYFDSLTSLSGGLFKNTSQVSRLNTAFLLFVLGVVMAFFYAWLTGLFLQGVFPAPTNIEPGNFGPFTFFYPLIGSIIGFAQGLLVSLLTTLRVTAVHPLESHRESVPLVRSYLISNALYGAVAMTCHSVLLPVLLNQ